MLPFRLDFIATVRKMASMNSNATHWLGPWLRSVRLKDKVPVKDVASKLDLDPSNLLRRERGGATIGDHELKATLDAYGVTPERFAAQMRRQS